MVVADPKARSFQSGPVGKKKFASSCDIVERARASSCASYADESSAPGAIASVRMGATTIAAFKGNTLDVETFKTRSNDFGAKLKPALAASGYPEQADPTQIDTPMVILVLSVLAIFVTMVDGPMAAWLVELFPTRIRWISS